MILLYGRLNLEGFRLSSTQFGLPKGKYTFGTRLGGQPAGRQVLAEVGSFSLEFGRLAQITGKAEYYDVVSCVIANLTSFQYCYL